MFPATAGPGGPEGPAVTPVSLKDVGLSREALQGRLDGTLTDAIERIVDRSRNLYSGIP